jgi:hypothetical protein
MAARNMAAAVATNPGYSYARQAPIYPYRRYWRLGDFSSENASPLRTGGDAQ